MNIFGNLIWLLFGGFIIAIEYLIASILMMATIIGIPFGIQTLKLASLALWPFGRETIQTRHADGCLMIILNIIWIFLGGLWIALSHLILAVLLSLTIIGIPFARQHIKLAAMGLTPFGRVIRDVA